MRRNLGNLAVAAVLSAALLFGACGDSANSVAGLEEDAGLLEGPGEVGGDFDEGQDAADDGPEKVPVDENGRPL